MSPPPSGAYPPAPLPPLGGGHPARDRADGGPRPRRPPVADAVEQERIAQAPLLLLAIALLTPALVSAGLLAAAAGYALGVPVGFPLALLGLTLGALLAVVLVRLTCGPGRRPWLGPRVAAFAAWVEARPLRSVIFSRLVPGLPFGVTSYACGLTRISLSLFAAGTAIGFAPRCFVYTALGGSIRDLGSPEAVAALVGNGAIALASLSSSSSRSSGLYRSQTTTEPRYRWTT